MSGHPVLDTAEDGDDMDVIAALIERAMTTSWQCRGACHGLDTQSFFPERDPGTDDYREQVVLLCKLCSRCPVMDLCRAASFGRGGELGVWGGLDERVRKTVLRGGADATRASLRQAVEQTAALAAAGQVTHDETRAA